MSSPRQRMIPSLSVALLAVFMFLSSCDWIESLTPETDTEKTIRIFTEGSPWKVDSLVIKTDVLSGGVSTILSDTFFLNYGTIEFTSPEKTPNPGYGAGFMIHRYQEDGQTKVDTSAWVPYNFNSGNSNYITLFFSEPGQDWVVGAYDMYLDRLSIGEKLIHISGWRRETIYGGSGGSNGVYRSYYLKP